MSVSTRSEVRAMPGSLADTPRLLSRGLTRPLAFAAAALGALVLIWTAAAVAIPRASISPATNLTNIRTDQEITVKTPRFTSISRVEVAINGIQRSLAYNIEGSSYTVPLQLEPGSNITVTLKATSPLGLIREFDSTFSTMAPMQLSLATAAGKPLSENSAISPQTTLDFSFDRPVEKAWVTIDGSVPVPLDVTPDSKAASLSPTFVLKQGATHDLKVWALGKDGSALPVGNNFRFAVVAPLELRADINTLDADADADSTITLNSSVPFEKPAMVENTLQVSQPEICQVKVSPTQIILTVNKPLTEALTLTVPSAFGDDGSYLEMPAKFSFQPDNVFATGSIASGSLAVTSSPAPRPAPPTGSALTEGQSDIPPPPPGWPPCCPWPPR